MVWKEKLYIDTVTGLLFGLRSAPKIFSALSDALEWILKHSGVSHCIHYLDDFLTLGSPLCKECGKNLEIIIKICKILGLPLAVEKVEGPVCCITFLGIILDSIKMEIRLPQEKLSQLKQLIQSWLVCRKAQKRELLSLIGHLAHAAKIVPPGRTFIRRMLDVAHSKTQLHHWIYLNKAFHSDLLCWKLFLDNWHGVSCLQTHIHSQPDFVLYTDASGAWGCGAI